MSNIVGFIHFILYYFMDANMLVQKTWKTALEKCVY